MYILKIFIILFLFIAVSAAATEKGIVKRVNDADIIVVIVNGYDVKVRLIGIDNPESKQNDKPFFDSGRSGKDVEAIFAQGLQASAFMKSELKKGIKT
jgi:endonuclease YncB( thermonuclease family)